MFRHKDDGGLEFADVNCAKLQELMADVSIRELAFLSAVNLIANAVSKCEFKTFYKGEEQKGPEYYLWNVAPNKNQSSSEFIHKWVSTLYRNGECLIIEQGGQLLVADSFEVKEYALFDNVYTEVTVGDFVFGRSFLQSEVLHFRLSTGNIREVLDQLYGGYSKLIAYAMSYYQKSRGTKGTLKIDTVIPAAGSPERESFDKFMTGGVKTWLSSDFGALPLGRGQEWKDVARTAYSSESTRDIRAMIDDISDFTARSMGIPPLLLTGAVQDVSNVTDQLLTFCIDPLTDMFDEEINRKRSGESAFLSGTYVHIDTKSIKHVDLLSVSTAIDKLIASGVFCINDIRKLVDEPVIDEEWAWRHFITKNYTLLTEGMTELGGGEQNAQ